MKKNLIQAAILAALLCLLFDSISTVFSQEILHRQARKPGITDALSQQQIYEADVIRASFQETRSRTAEKSGIAIAITKSHIPEPDTDDDGMPDVWETANGLDPHDATDAWQDPDSDHVINLFEYQLNGVPHDASTPTVMNVSAEQDVATALNVAANGGVIRVQSGVYMLNYRTFFPKTLMIQGGWNADFTQRDLSPAATIFDGSVMDSTEVLYFSFHQDTNAVILDGLTLTKGAGSFGALNFLAAGTAVMKWSLRNCVIHHSAAKSGFGGAIHILHWDKSQAEVFVVQSFSVNNIGNGIYNQTVNEASGRWRIINSDIASNQRADSWEGHGIRAFTLDSARLDIAVKNTIVWGNQDSDLRLSGHGDHTKVQAEYTDIGTILLLGRVDFERGSGILDQDPLFINASNGDFSLAPGSPCLDAGIDLGLPFDGLAPDMGAIENLTTSVRDNAQPTRADYVLLQNYPNPFNPSTAIRFSLPKPTYTKLVVYDLLGTKVRTLAEGQESAGKQQVTWDATNDAGERVPSGVYWYRLEAGEFTMTRKLAVMK